MGWGFLRGLGLRGYIIIRMYTNVNTEFVYIRTLLKLNKKETMFLGKLHKNYKGEI